MPSKMTQDEAYRAMLLFLEDYYQRTGADDIGALLGDLTLNSSGESLDPATLDDWRDAVGKVLAPVTEPAE